MYRLEAFVHHSGSCGRQGFVSRLGSFHNRTLCDITIRLLDCVEHGWLSDDYLHFTPGSVTVYVHNFLGVRGSSRDALSTGHHQEEDWQGCAVEGVPYAWLSASTASRFD